MIESRAPRTAFTTGAVFTLLSLWNIYRHRWILAEVLGVFGVALLIVQLIPAWSRAFHHWWMRFAAVLGAINSRILLTIMYFAVLTPYGFLLRRLGRDPFDRRGPKRDSYWVRRSYTRQNREQFGRLF